MWQMKAAKQCLGKEQRREAARIRSQKVENIMNAENNSKTFFKLIKDQRKSSNPQTETLIVENQSYETEEDICQGWAKHFQSLATPLQNAKFDSEHKKSVDRDVACIKSICETENKEIRRKIKIALFPLTYRRRDRVGRSESLFIFRVFFSFLKMGKKGRVVLKLIISTGNKHAMKCKTSRKLKNTS